MYEIQWFKVEANIFSNRKMKILLKLRDGDTYFRIWIQLIALAVECNHEGRLEIGDNIPMTIKDFSKIMGKSEKKMEKIVQKLVELDMLNWIDGTYLIKNWDKYQSIDKLEKTREKNRIRQQKYREKLKSGNEKNNVILTLDNVEEEIKEKNNIRTEENTRKEKENGLKLYEDI